MSWQMESLQPHSRPHCPSEPTTAHSHGPPTGLQPAGRPHRPGHAGSAAECPFSPAAVLIPAAHLSTSCPQSPACLMLL